MACDVAESAQSLVAAFGSAMDIAVTTQLPERVVEQAKTARPARASKHAGMSRREALRGMKAQSQHAAQAAMSAELDDKLGGAAAGNLEVPAAYRKVGKNGTLSHYVPTRRTRLYNYLHHIGAGKPLAASVTSRVVGAAAINADACTSCRMCAVFCPTSAIEKLDDEARDLFGVVHRPAACMQCRLCERICPAQAIHISQTVPTEQFMGKQAVVFPMEKPSWKANTPTSMFEKIHSVIGKDVNMSSF